MNKKREIEMFFQKYLASLQEGLKQARKEIEAWYFCDNEKDANELGDLVKAGIKTATCSLLWAYQAENEDLPEVGDLSVVTNWIGKPLCVIETVEVQIKAFNEVDEKFAYDEGEGDRTLAYW
jgi:uncharacterized protein YhfF